MAKCFSGSKQPLCTEGVALKGQGGFTLLEIMIVVVAIGGLMALLIPNITGGSSRQDAMLMERVARSISSNYDMVNRTCGTSTRISSNNVLDSQDTEGVANLIFYGLYDSNYERCYERSGVSPQSSDVDAAGGDFRLTGTDMPITFEDQDSPRSFNVIFDNVSADIVEAAVQRFDTSIEFDDLGSISNVPDQAKDRAPLHVSGSGDNMTVTYRFLW